MSENISVLQKPLSGYVINKIFRNLESTKNLFLGVYARGHYPPVIRKTPSFYIINTDYIHNSKGIHWLLIFHSKDKIYFFDPLGLSPSSIYNFPFLVEENDKTLTRNTQCVQNYSAETCGYFCVFVGILLSKGHHTLHEIIKKNFIKATDTFYNDWFVYFFIRNIAWEILKINI